MRGSFRTLGHIRPSRRLHSGGPAFFLRPFRRIGLACILVNTVPEVKRIILVVPFQKVLCQPFPEHRKGKVGVCQFRVFRPDLLHIVGQRVVQFIFCFVNVRIPVAQIAVKAAVFYLPVQKLQRLPVKRNRGFYWRHR